MDQQTIFRRAHQSNFVTVGNDVARNKALSHRARGILFWLLSYPPTWNIQLDNLKTHRDGRDAIRKAIEELEDAGHLVRRQFRGETGRWGGAMYMVYESPVPDDERSGKERRGKAVGSPSPEKPSTEKPLTDSPLTANPTLQIQTPLNTEFSKDEKQVEVGDSHARAHESERPAIYAVYEAEIGPLTPIIAEQLRDWVTTYTEVWVEAAIRQAVLAGVRKPNYVRSVLENWRATGFGSPAPGKSAARTSAARTPAARPSAPARSAEETARASDDLQRQLAELKAKQSAR